MRLCGVDPGLSGAIALYRHDNRSMSVVPMPVRTDAREVDCPALLKVFEDFNPDVIWLEDVHGPFGWKFPQAFGALICVVALSRYRAVRVAPRTWQAAILGSCEGKTKALSIAHCQKRWPAANIIPEGKRAPDHNRSDAVNIAEYGLLHG